MIITFLKTLLHPALAAIMCFYIQSFSLTECIVIVGVRKTGVVCLCVCVCVCLSRAVWRNYWADFNQIYPNWSPYCLVVSVCYLARYLL